MTKTEMTKTEISPEELIALKAFAAAHGRRWKSELSEVYWYNARIWYDSAYSPKHGYVLHGLRNRLGVNWLDNFQLPKKD